MINNNKAYHVSNLYEEKLNRSSKKPTHNNNPSFKNSISSQNPKSKRTENSLGIVYTEPSPYEDPEKILKYKGIPNSHPLEKPCKDLNNFDDFTTPTENPAYFLKELPLKKYFCYYYYF